MSKKWEENEIETLIDLNSQKLSRKEISEKMGRTKTAINIKMRDLGIYSETTNYLTEQDKEIITSMLKNGSTIKEAAVKLNRNKSYISKIAKELGFITRKSKQITEQLSLKKEGKRKCYKCKNIYPYPSEHFTLTRRLCRKCNCEKSKEGYQKLKNGISLEKLLQTRVSQCKNRAKSKGLDFDITKEHLLEIYEKQGGLCHYSGIPLEISLGSKRNNSRVLSLDREDNDKGYIVGNIVLCCDAVNTMKNTMTKEEFLFICSEIIKHQALSK